MDNESTLSARVAEEIRAMLARRRVTGRELARRLEVSSPWVSQRLTGHTEIGLNDLERIAAALETDVADLLPRPALRDERATRGISPDYRRPAPRPRSAHLIDVAHRDRTAESGSVPAAKSARVTGPRARPSWIDAGGAA